MNKASENIKPGKNMCILQYVISLIFPFIGLLLGSLLLTKRGGRLKGILCLILCIVNLAISLGISVN